MKAVVSKEEDQEPSVSPNGPNLYARHADSYDTTFGVAVNPSNQRLSADLCIGPTDRVLDLACGTGSSSLAMARLAFAGETVCVDSSPEMLAMTNQRFKAAAVKACLVNADLAAYIDAAPRESFDVITLRFGLTYFDWKAVLPGVTLLLRPGGRLGIVTNLGDSLVQVQSVYRRLARSPRPIYLLYRESGGNLVDTWRRYRAIRAHFATPTFIRVPPNLDDIMETLSASDLITQTSWVETRRLFFDTGLDAVDWLFRSGCVAHAPLESLEVGTTAFLQKLFAHSLEEFGTRLGVPLDMRIAGVVLRK